MEPNVSIDSEFVAHNDSESTQLPDFIKTQSGIGITFYDRQKNFPTRVRYGSVSSACLVEAPSIDPGPILEKIMEAGFVQNKDGSVNQEIAVPVEFVKLPKGENCSVVITDLSGYSYGFDNLQAQEDVTVDNLFKALSKFANAVACLKDNGLYIKKWNAHSFYFNAQFGMFTMVLDEMMLSDDGKLNAEGAVDKALAATLLKQLTGAFPVTAEGTPYGTLIEAQADAVICFESVDKSIHIEDFKVEKYWNALPKKLREAFETCFFAPEVSTFDAAKWAQLFADIAESIGIETCFHCGKQIVSDASVCAYCGGNLDKRKLVSKWLVVDKMTSFKFGLGIPLNMVLDSAMLAPNRLKGGVFRMGYNAKRNILALQNFSNDVLDVDYGELGIINAEPQSIFALKPGMQITGLQLPDITLKFMGFEFNDSWEEV